MPASSVLAGGNRSKLARLEALVADIGMSVATDPDDEPWAAAEVAARLREVEAHVRTARQEAENQVILRTSRGKHAQGNVYVARTRVAKRTNWRNGDILRRLDAEGATLLAVAHLAAVSYWKAGRPQDPESPGLSWYGIDRDDYCDLTWAESVTVEVRR